MIELELMLNDLQKMYSREKSLRNRVLLEKVILGLQEYERTVVLKQELLLNAK